MSSRRGPLLLLVALLGVALLVPAAVADSNARIVRLSYVDGSVQLDRRDGHGYDRAIMNMPVTQGTRVWTRGDNSLAEVEFEDGSTLRLAPETSVEFQELSLRSSGEKVTSLDLEEGTAYFDMKGKSGDFRVTFGGQQLSVTRSAQFRLRVRKSEVKLAVYKGEVDVRSGANQVEVRKNETFSVDLTDPGRYLLAKGIQEDVYDDWNNEREKYRDTYSYSSNAYRGYSSWSSPYYSYGLTDLNYYGSYFNAPGYGWLWRPYYISSAWDPFMDGAWAWYPGYGYMWVSAYPWGWMPYRYGSWVFVSGYGWSWQPGHTWNTWAPVTVVRNAPTGWVAPKPPATPPQSGGGAMVVVGKGARTIFPPGENGSPGRPRRLGLIDEPESRGGKSTVGAPGGKATSAAPTTMPAAASGAASSTTVAQPGPTPGSAASAAAAPATHPAPVAPTSPGSKTTGPVPRPRRTMSDDSDLPRGGKTVGPAPSAPAPSAPAPKASPAPAPSKQSDFTGPRSQFVSSSGGGRSGMGHTGGVGGGKSSGRTGGSSSSHNSSTTKNQ